MLHHSPELARLRVAELRAEADAARQARAARADTTVIGGSISRTLTSATTRRRSGPLVAALLALLAGGLLAPPAGAYTITSRTNVPVTPTVYQVQGKHHNIGNDVSGPMYRPWISQSGPVVTRVSPRGTQYAKVVYRIDRWNGAWVQVATQSKSVTIASTVTSAKAPALSILPSEGAGYYRVRLSITWTSEIGAVLGSMNVSMNTAGDYVCATTRTCRVASGWIYLGS